VAAGQRRAGGGERQVGDRDLQRLIGAIGHFALHRQFSEGGVEAQAKHLQIFRVLKEDLTGVQRHRIAHQR
jgi:hypothetical protein